MEQKLKQQRNKLFLRITLILLIVWLAVSATYCVIRLHSEKMDVQNRMLSNFSYAKQMLSLEMVNFRQPSYIFVTDGNLIELKDLMEQDFDSQIIVIDPDTGETLADTAGKIRVVFTFQTDKGTYPDDYGYLDYSAVRSAMSDTQYREIAGWLNTRRNDGRSYELVCTAFYTFRDKIVPLELSVMLTEHPDDKFDPDNIVAAFAMNNEAPEKAYVFHNAADHLNLIPKDFLLNNGYNHDYISLLTEAQREKSFEVLSVGPAEYIFYTTDYFYLNAYTFNKETNRYEKHKKLFLGQYAKKASLIQSCGSDLISGVAVIFVFFFLIGTVLFLMIWHTVRTQILQEQKRADFTNALAHDIKTPLFVISGYAYSLREMMDQIDSAERDSYLERIIEQTEKINCLVHKMLNLSKLDSYRMTLTRTAFDLAELTEDVLRDFTLLPDGKQIAFTHSGSHAVSADRELIRTAIQNLIDNAVKYSLPDSEIQIDVSDRILHISNPSEPFTKAELREIWQPYMRKDKSRSQKGNGLGLSIVKSILDLHGVKYEMGMKHAVMVFRAEFPGDAP